MDKSIEGIPTISASKLKTYKTCQKQYYNKYIVAKEDRTQEQKNVAALLGSALHKAIEEKYKSGKSPTGIFQGYMSDKIVEWEAAGYEIKMLDYYSRAIIVGKGILKDFPWDMFNPIELEYAFTLPFPNKENPIVNITGLIDMIDMNGSVIDHKSATYAPNVDDVSNDAQFLIYAFAYEQIHGVRPYKVIWNHLRTNRQIEADIYNNYQDKLDQLTNDIEAMIHNKYFARINSGNICRTQCSFYQQCYGAANTSVTEDVIEE